MLKIKNKFTKRILALALSGAMIVSSLTTSGLTAYAAEDSQNTHSGYSEEISDTDNEAAQTEEAEENEGNKDAENPADPEREKDSEESAKTEFSKSESDKKEPVKTESVKETSDKEESVKEDSAKTEEAGNTDDEDREKDEKAEDVKAYTYSAPSASEKGAWDNYDVFRGSVFGISTPSVTDKTYYTLESKNGNMHISVAKNGNKIAIAGDGRAMYFYQVPINSSFTLKAKATINSIGNEDKNDGQVGFGLMARDDMLIDQKYDSETGAETYTRGEGYSSDYVAAGILMGSTAKDSTLTTSTNGFYRENGTLNRGAALDGDKIVGAGETYDLSLTFDGTKYTWQINEYTPVERTIALNNIDSQYQYIGMFAARKADITFSKIYLEVDGKRILDQVSTRYSVTVSKEGNGTVSADSTSVIAGDTVTLTAKPGNGYYLDGWQIVEGDNLVTEFEIDENNQFTMPKGNVSIKAIFKEIPTKWDFENDDTHSLSARFEDKTGKVAGLEIDATNGLFDSTEGLAKVSKGTTITVPLPGECTLTVVGEDKNYTVDGKAAETPEVSFTCGGIRLKTAVITATENTGIKCITVTSSGKEEIVLPETPRKIDVWDFGAKEQSGSNYVNHIKVSDWTNFSSLKKLENGRFAVAPGDDSQHPIEDATASFGDLTFCYHNGDYLYSTAYTGGFNHQPNQSMRSEATHAYGDYTAAGEWYCNGTGGSNRRCITIDNVVAGDVICAYLGVSNGIETKFYFEYLGTEEGKNQKDVGTVEKGTANGVNKKFTFIAKYSGTYKIWADTAAPAGETTVGKPFYNRIVRYPAVGMQGTIDWANISGEGLSIQFVNDTTNEATNAVFDSTGYAVILAPGYTYTARLVGNNRYAFTDDSGTIALSSTDGVNGKTHNLVVQDLDALHEVSGKFIGLGKAPLTGVNATKLVFRNIDNENETYEAQIADDTYSVSLKKGAYAAEITAEGYSTRTQVTVKNAPVTRDLFLVGPENDTSLTRAADLYVGYLDKEGSYETINAALRDAKRMNPQSEAERITIHIYPGIYREQVFVNVNYITLINDTPEREVKITWYYGIGYAYYSVDESGYYNDECAYNKLEKHNAARWGCAVRVKAKDFKAKNIVFENSFNRYMTTEEIEDGVVLNTTGTDSKATFVRKSSSTASELASGTATERAAALALDTGSDRSEFYNCKFYSSQDTLYTGDGNSRAYYKNCLISGNTDYIFGDGNQVFENCELNWQGYTSGAKGGHITAAKDTSTLGYLFYNCKITKNKASGFTVETGTLGRTWGAKARVTYVNTVQEAANLISNGGWSNMNGDPKNANYKEYNTRLENGTEINHSTSPRKDIYVTEDPTKKAETGIKAYFGEDWKPTFYDWSTESGNTGESGNTPETGDQNETGSTPETGDRDETGSTPETGDQNETGSTPESGGDDNNKDIYIRGLEPSYPYTGAKIIPDIEVLYGTTILLPDIDYKVSYKNNVKPGTDTAEVIVTGKGNYAGKAVSRKFSIKEITDVKDFTDLKGAKMDKIDPVPYKGEAWYPDFTLTFKDGSKVTYTQNTDPTDDSKGLYKRKDSNQPMNVYVAVSNNINKGTATILVTGGKDDKGKTTSIKKTFKITAVDISTAAVTVEDATYAVSGAIPKVTVEYKGTPLKLGKDYTLKYAKNKTAASKGTVTVVGKGNYTKKCPAKEYTIKKLDMSTLTVNAVTASVGGKPSKIKATINDGTGTALKASQYTLSVYRDKDCNDAYTVADQFEEPGTVYVVAKAKEGSKDLMGETTPKAFQVGIDISKAKVTGADGKAVTKEYTGKAITLKATDLKVTLKVNGKEKTLIPDQDYKIATHFNNINKGSATVVLQGVGPNGYSGTKTFKFKITQRSIQDKALKPWEEMSKVISNMLSSLSSK